MSGMLDGFSEKLMGVLDKCFFTSTITNIENILNKVQDSLETSADNEDNFSLIDAHLMGVAEKMLITEIDFIYKGIKKLREEIENELRDINIKCYADS